MFVPWRNDSGGLWPLPALPLGAPEVDSETPGLNRGQSWGWGSWGWRLSAFLPRHQALL